MADFYGKENLLAFKGARVFSGLDPNHPQMNWVCIPVPYNDIELTADGRFANVGVRMNETSDKYRQACITRRQMAGDSIEDYTPPSHMVEVAFSKEFREKAMEAARKRIIQEKEEWRNNPDLQDPKHNNELRNAIYDAVRLRLGSFYARIRQSQTMQTAAPVAAGQAQAWTPPPVDPITGQPLQPGYNPSYDDLPF